MNVIDEVHKKLPEADVFVWGLAVGEIPVMSRFDHERPNRTCRVGWPAGKEDCPLFHNLSRTAISPKFQAQ